MCHGLLSIYSQGELERKGSRTEKGRKPSKVAITGKVPGITLLLRARKPGFLTADPKLSVWD